MTDPETQRNPVELLADAFLERYRRGERPSLTEYTRRHPELADQIRELFPALVLMEEVGPGEQENAPTSSPRLERLGEYRILREVGRGGMGVVYEAEQESLGRHVALKVLPGHSLLDTTQRERFRREAKTAARLHHSNIVPVFGVGEQGGIHYYAMQFIQGQGLDVVLQDVKRLRQRRETPPARGGSQPWSACAAVGLLSGRFDAGGRTGTMPPAESDLSQAPGTAVPAPVTTPSSDFTSQPDARYFRSVAQLGVQVCEALTYAHGHGVLHRDVKPSNLLLDTAGTVWVTDFGLAKVEGAEELTSPGDVVGTLRYLPPERFHGQSDIRSDIYSLGATLYELLTLEPAFPHANRVVLVDRIAHEDPAPPRRLDPRLPRDLETIVLKALRKEPAKRYQTAEDLAADLRRFLAGEPIRARPIGTWERVLKWVKRRPAVAALLTLVAVVALAGFGGVTWQWLLAEEGRRLAEDARRLAEDARQNEARAYRAKEELNKQKERHLYANYIALAHHEWWANGVPRARALLDECPPALRGWEWHYLTRLCRSPDSAFPRIESLAKVLAYSPDGKRLAWTAGAAVKVSDVATGREVLALANAAGKSTALVFSPLVFSPRGDLLATAKEDRAVTVWDARTGQNLFTLPGCVDLAFSSDGNHLLTVAQGLEVSTWEARSGRLVNRSRPFFPGSWLMLRLARDGRHLAARTIKGIKVWDVATGNVVFDLPNRPATRYWLNFILSPDGRFLVRVDWGRAFSNQTVEVWDTTRGKHVCTYQAHRLHPSYMAFSADGGRLALVDDHGVVLVLDVPTGRQVRSYRGHPGITGLAFSPDGRFLAASDKTGLKVWSMADNQYAQTLLEHPAVVERLAFSSDGRRLAAAGSDQTVQVTELPSGRRLSHRKLPYKSVLGLSFGPPGDRLFLAGNATGGRIDVAVVWDAITGRQLLVLSGHAGWVQAVAIAPDGALVASGGTDGLVKLWDVRAGCVAATLRGHAGPVLCAAFSPDGRRLATAGKDAVIRTWNPATGQQVAALRGHTNAVGTLRFSLDGRLLISAGDYHELGREVKVWDLGTGSAIFATRSSLVRTPNGVALSADNRRLAMGSTDRSVKFWDLESRLELLTLQTHSDALAAVAFSPNGRWLLTAGTDVKLWDGTELPVQAGSR
jgi:WD40 repeat protein/serine/threonine protein kinase